MSTRWTPEAVRELGVVTDLETAGSIFGLGRTLSHELARNGKFPTPLLRIGSSYRAPIAPILAALGIQDMDEAGATTPANVTDTTDNTRSPHAKSNGLRVV